jgi:ABC-type amino acid transport substrate-binding protein
MRDRAFARRLAVPYRRSLIGLAGCSLLLFSACDQPVAPPAPPAKPGISVVVRPGPATWFISPGGQASGFDHDLLTRFARERGVALNVVFADGAAALLTKIASGEAQLGAACSRPRRGNRATMPMPGPPRCGAPAITRSSPS